MNIEFIGVPLYYGCDNPGTEQAWKIICSNGLAQMTEACGHAAAGFTTVEVPPVMDKDADQTMKYCQEVTKTCKSLENAVAAVCEAGNFPIVIGGDHSLGIGTIAGLNHSVPKEELTVIWVDAHTDINTNETSASHNIHGMPLAACLGLGSKKLIDGFGKEEVKLLPQNLFYIGTRSVDPGEQEILNRLGIRFFDMEELKTKGIEKATQELLSLVKTKKVHVSFDVDFMGSAEYIATGLPVPNGPTVEQAHCCLRLLMQDPRVSSLDFVEYSPKNDGDGKGLAVCMSLLNTCLDVMKR